MFYMTDLQQTDKEELQNIFFKDYDSNGEISSQYTINIPYRITYSCLMPDNIMDKSEITYALTYITPIGSMYSCFGMDTDKDKTVNLHHPHLHRHDFFELMYVIDGTLYQNIEHKRHVYTKGSLCILNKNVRHTEEYNTDFKILFLQLRTDFMMDIYNSLKLDLFNHFENKSDLMDFFKTNLTDNKKSKDYMDFIPFKDNDSIAHQIHGIFDTIINETLSPTQQSSIIIKRSLEDLFGILSSPKHFSTIPVKLGGDTENDLFDKITSAMEYTNGRISRSELSEVLNYSGSYLNDICKKHSGLSIFDYGMTFCMKEAARLLTASNENISDIMNELGFTNPSHFYKTFKKHYNYTPAQYRKMHL
ncbi:MAG: AraC family transcriptional regulator [Lachnospiraceae bacterium]|nr:AraC family transcriptional regulator [Lachnospiraceae bacterium]